MNATPPESSAPATMPAPSSPTYPPTSSPLPARIWPVIVGRRYLLRCSCGFATLSVSVDELNDAPLSVRPMLDDDMRHHLADQHSGEVGYGLCGECEAITDYFRIHAPELGTDAWLCQAHGPEIET